MLAIFKKIAAFFMTILAFFGVGKGASDTPQPQQVTDIAAYTLHTKTLDFAFYANASTGYAWEVKQSGDAVKLTRDEYVQKNSSSVPGGPAMAGAPGEQQYTFTAVRPGRATLTFTYRRSWETDPPLYTYVAELTVSDALEITVESFTER